MSVVIQTRYREEFTYAFERTRSVLMPTVNTDSEDRGGSIVFNVAGSGGATVVTRGSSGLIPPADDSQTQVTVTLVEEHYLNEKTNFDIFKAQGNQLSLMSRNSLAVVHRGQDARIITAIATGTVDLGAIGTMNKSVANKLLAKLGNADAGVEDDGMLFAAVTPAAWAYLTDITSFANSDYVNFGGQSPVEEGLPQLGRFKNWMGINWTQHGGLTGKGTSSATCLAWHKMAVGYAMGTMGVDAEVGYDRKQHTSWARASVFHGAAKLQNAGIVKFTHDDSGIS